MRCDLKLGNDFSVVIFNSGGTDVEENEEGRGRFLHIMRRNVLCFLFLDKFFNSFVLPHPPRQVQQ